MTVGGRSCHPARMCILCIGMIGDLLGGRVGTKAVLYVRKYGVREQGPAGGWGMGRLAVGTYCIVLIGWAMLFYGTLLTLLCRRKKKNRCRLATFQGCRETNIILTRKSFQWLSKERSTQHVRYTALHSGHDAMCYPRHGS